VEQAGGSNTLTDGQRAAIVGISTLLGGVTAGLAGQNAQAGANAATNEALNNSTNPEDIAHGKDLMPLEGGVGGGTGIGGPGGGEEIFPDAPPENVGGSASADPATVNTGGDGPNVGWANTTIGRSIPNSEIGLTRDQFEQNLLDSGFTATTKGGANDVTVYTNGSIQYTVRNNASSTGGPSVDYRVNGNLVSKIRLNGQ